MEPRSLRAAGAARRGLRSRLHRSQAEGLGGRAPQRRQIGRELADVGFAEREIRHGRPRGDGLRVGEPHLDLALGHPVSDPVQRGPDVTSLTAQSVAGDAHLVEDLGSILLRDDGVGPDGRHRKQQRLRREPVEVHLADPGEEGDERLDLVIREIISHHLALAGIHGLGILEHGPNEARAAALVDLCELRRIVSAFSQESVAAHAVELVPKMLPLDHERRHLILIRERWDLGKRVNGERDEGTAREDGLREKETFGLRA